MTKELNYLVGGEAGQGVQTIGFVLAKSLARGGWHVFADQDYESRVRGGHNFYRVRTSPEALRSQTDKLDLVIALDRATLDLHRAALKPGGLIIADAESLNLGSEEVGIINIPLERLALEAAGDKIMANSVAAGAALGLIDFPFEILAGTLRWHFAKTTEASRESNVRAAQAGYDYTRQHKPDQFTLKFVPGQSGDEMLINGNEAIALGALAAGCQFAAIYPMTPITSILDYLADKGRQYGMGVIQPEDEISAINMVIGAAYTGVRAMTATSGSGFALMVEGLGLAGMTETPAVIVLGQRPGPAIGLPTRTEQGELLFAIHSGTGEFPKIVLAPADAEDVFYVTFQAFNLAEQYQVPVIILTDTHLANSYTDVKRFDLSGLKIERGEWASPSPGSDYRRYQITPTGISPRLRPGQSAVLVAADSDEHDDSGHLTESALIKTGQTAKRLKKYESIRRALTLPRFHQTVNAGITLVGWGSTYGAIMEVSRILTSRGVSNNVLHFNTLWPFPADFVTAALKGTPVSIVIENNSQGQLASLIKAETGMTVTRRINKWDGRPISAEYILTSLRKE